MCGTLNGGAGPYMPSRRTIFMGVEGGLAMVGVLARKGESSENNEKMRRKRFRTRRGIEVYDAFAGDSRKWSRR